MKSEIRMKPLAPGTKETTHGWIGFINIAIVSAGFLLAPICNASAQDLFAGSYVGASIGKSSADGSVDGPLLSGGTSVQNFNASDGRSYGLFGGYNFRHDALVYGFEASYLSLSGLGLDAVPGPESTEVSELVDLKARLGYAQGNWLFYGTLGWSVAHLHVHPGIEFATRPNTTTIDGASLGVGVEYIISESLSAGADYTQRSLSGDFDEATSETDLDVDTLVLRIVYNF